jgi:phosphoribosylformylglycinamidine synthase
VSLYNEGVRGPIYPTPVIGMVGRLPDARRVAQMGFAHARDAVALAGAFAPSLAAGELERLRGEPLPDGLADLDLEAVRTAQLGVRDAVRAGALASAHDVAEGGLAVALGESCLAGGLGARIELPDDLFERLAAPAGRAASARARMNAALFGEGSGGFIVSGEEAALLELADELPLRVIGAVGGESLAIALADERLVVSLAELAEAHGSLEQLFR